jgi:hypothetical protein
MDLWIPAQTLDIQYINLGSFQPSENQRVLIAPLKYKSPTVSLNTLTILTPTLTVIHHDPHTGRIVLDASDHPFFVSKLALLHEAMAMTLAQNQQTFFHFPLGLTADHFKRMLFPLVNNKRLTLFMGASARTLKYTTGGGHGDVFEGFPGAAASGQKMRVAFTLQGISVLSNSFAPALIPVADTNIFRIRFQQSIAAVFAF